MARHNLSILRDLVRQTKTTLGTPASPPDSHTQERLTPTREEASSLSAVLLLFALKIIQQNVGLQRLGAITDQSAQIKPMMRELYDRLVSFCGKPIGAILPFPEEYQAERLATVWSSFSRPSAGCLWSEVINIGYVYQFFSMPSRRQSQSDIQSANKSSDLDRLIRFTQLYTPAWVVDFLLQNTMLTLTAEVVGTGERRRRVIELPERSEQYGGAELRNRAAIAARPYKTTTQGILIGDCKTRRYLLPDRAEKADVAVENFRLLDPACGGGHFLVGGFDLLRELYEEGGWSTQEAVKSILERNLAGADIDSVALWVSALSLLVKLLIITDSDDAHFYRLVEVSGHTASGAEPDLLGSLSPVWKEYPEHLLSETYHAVVTNPPYLGRKLLDRQLKSSLKQFYPRAHNDLCAAFIQLGLELLKPGGRLGVITQASLMYLPSYSELRSDLIEKENLVAAVEAGPGVFPLQGGEKVNSVLLVLERNGRGDAAPVKQDRIRPGDAPTSPGHSLISRQTPSPHTRTKLVFIDLTQETDKEASLATQVSSLRHHGSKDCYLVEPSAFRNNKTYAFNYKCPAIVMEILRSADTLSAVADVRQGLATTDNSRFVRYWWDVDPSSINKRWFPYVKGAGSGKWYEPIRHVVDWEDEGQTIKRAVALAYPYLKGKTAWVVKNEDYYFKEGLTFSFVNTNNLSVRHLPAGCIFDVGGSAVFAPPDKADALLAYLNSSLIATIATTLNPTINYQVGDLKKLPLFELSEAEAHKLSEHSLNCRRLKESLRQIDQTAIGCSVPSEIQEMSSSADIERSCSSYFSRAESSRAQLMQCEEGINDVILHAVSHTCSLSKGDFSLLKHWCENSNGHGMIDKKPVTAVDLVLVALLYCLNRSVGRQGLLILPDNEDIDISPMLEVPDSIAGWIKKEYGMSLAKFLSSNFADRHRRDFFGSPIYFFVPLKPAPAFLLLTTGAIRQSISGNDPTRWNLTQSLCSGLGESFWTANEAARERADNILQQIIAHIKPIPDWTGVDVLRATQSIQAP